MAQLPGYTNKLALVVLFICAVWVRTEGLGDYPYYKGTSATNYRHAGAVADNGKLPARDVEAAFPDGYEPARVQANGAEYVTGFAYRIARIFSDMPQKNFLRMCTAFVFALSVLLMAALTWELWRCQAATLIAAFMTAFFGPLVLETDGRDFVHAPFAATLIVLHLTLYFGVMRNNSSTWRVWTTVPVVIALLAVWEGASLYLMAFGIPLVFFGAFDPQTRRRFVLAHFLALVIAGIAFAHLREIRFLASWEFWLYTAALVYVFAKDKLPARVPAPVFFLVGFGALGILSRPFRVPKVSTLEYWAERIAHVGGKPFEPGDLSEVARYLWTHDHAAPIAQTQLEFFLPLVLLLPVALLAMRQFKRESEFFTWQPVALAIVGTVMFLFDRSAVVAASIGMIPVVALCGYGFSQHVKLRGLPFALGMLVVLLSSTSSSIAGRIGQRMSLTPTGGDGFLAVSIGNPDKELMRHVLTRTSLRDPFLAPPDVSALLTTFAGRTCINTSGLPEHDDMMRTMQYTRALYLPEKELYELCHELNVVYVVYSTHLLMDTSRYSLRYMTGLRGIAAGSVAEGMHFAPEALDHFNLVYQNDNYRLFRVTAQQEPVFLTDHPIVYQRQMMRRFGDTTASFYNRVVETMVTYHTARQAQARGDERDAIRRFRYCVEQAPRFTEAWLGVGDSFTRLRDYEAAHAAYERVLGYAPDNERALYYGALTAAHLGDVDRAINLITILQSSSRDKELLALATELKAVIEQGLPLDNM